MKRKYIIPVMASLLALGGCDYNEDNFAGLDEMTRPTDVRNDTLRLVDSDYAAIANNSTNKEIALSKDPEGNTYAAALAAVGANKYFTEDAPADGICLLSSPASSLIWTIIPRLRSIITILRICPNI